MKFGKDTPDTPADVDATIEVPNNATPAEMDEAAKTFANGAAVSADLHAAIEAVLRADMTALLNGGGAYQRHVPETILALRRVWRRHFQPAHAAPPIVPRATMADNFVIAYAEWLEIVGDKSDFTEFAAQKGLLGDGDGQFTCFSLWDMKPEECASLQYDMLDFDDGSIAMRRRYGDYRIDPSQWVIARPDECRPRSPELVRDGDSAPAEALLASPTRASSRLRG